MGEAGRRRWGEAGAVAALRRETLAWVATELGSSLDAESHTIEDLSRMREFVAMLVELDPRENETLSEIRQVVDGAGICEQP